MSKPIKSYYVYILHCADGTYYTGMTKDLDNRLKQHNGNKQGGAKYTRTRRPVQLAYVEEIATFKETALREVQIKRLSRSKKKSLIQSNQDAT